jgi:hypothetical protein
MEPMLESPLLKKMVAAGKHEDILAVLKARFGTVPRDVDKHLRDILDQKRLTSLNVLASQCASLQAFRDALLS